MFLIQWWKLFYDQSNIKNVFRFLNKETHLNVKYFCWLCRCLFIIFGLERPILNLKSYFFFSNIHKCNVTASFFTLLLLLFMNLVLNINYLLVGLGRLEEVHLSGQEHFLWSWTLTGKPCMFYGWSDSKKLSFCLTNYCYKKLVKHYTGVTRSSPHRFVHNNGRWSNVLFCNEMNRLECRHKP